MSLNKYTVYIYTFLNAWRLGLAPRRYVSKGVFKKLDKHFKER